MKQNEQNNYPYDQPLRPSSLGTVWMGNMIFDSEKEAEKEKILQGRIVATKQYGEHILIQDSTGQKYDTKNISPLGCRIIRDGELIHGKDKKPDLILDYEL